MAQVAMTVRLDSQVKAQFDSLCMDFGMSANTAFNIFVKAVINTGSIPFPIGSKMIKREYSPNTFVNIHKADEARQAFLDLREEAYEKLGEISLDEINEEIRQYRAERKERQK